MGVVCATATEAKPKEAAVANKALRKGRLVIGSLQKKDEGNDAEVSNIDAQVVPILTQFARHLTHKIKANSPIESTVSPQHSAGDRTAHTFETPQTDPED